jgi:hypothetical protein
MKIDTDLSYYFTSNKKSLAVYKEFLSDLGKLSVSIRDSNQTRDWPLFDYDPAYVGISTAV